MWFYTVPTHYRILVDGERMCRDGTFDLCTDAAENCQSAANAANRSAHVIDDHGRVLITMEPQK